MKTNAEVRTKGLWLADFVMRNTFFVMQKYLTTVWGLGFTTAATILNIWNGVYMILPIFFLFVADTFLGNFWTLLLSGVSSTMGLGLITWITGAGYRCEKKGADEDCVGRTEKAVVITAMFLIALGRAARFASAKPFLHDQTGINHDDDDDADDDQINSNSKPSWKISDIVSTLSLSLFIICLIVFIIMPAAAFIAFPLVKMWYLLFGASAACTVFATILFVSSFEEYKNIKPVPRSDGSAITDLVRVFVAAFLNRSSLPSDSNSSPNLHVAAEDEEFKELSPSRFLGFLHKAAMKSDENGGEEKKKRSWRLCSVSEVESAKITIRMVPVYMTYLISGVVLSMGNTYLVDQAVHMNYHIGGWKPPLQLLHLFFIATRLAASNGWLAICEDDDDHKDEKMYPEIVGGGFGPPLFSVACCLVGALVERRRVHAIRGHDHSSVDDEVHMGAYLLLFQSVLLGLVEACLRYDLGLLHEKEAPKSTKRYHNCFEEGVIGVGYMCGALLVFVVGEVSEMGSSKNWFQHSLNRSRLDRYYWVLSVLTSLNFIVGLFFILSAYKTKFTLTRATATAESAPTKRRRRRTRRRRRWGHILNGI